jgi:hypothetical protein
MDITELLTAPSSPRLQEGVPYDAYARIPALRSGVLKDGIVRGAEREPIISPRHIKASYEGHVDRDSESMLFGRAMHTLLLEPKEFENRYCFYEGRRDERTKAYQECSKPRAHCPGRGAWKRPSNCARTPLCSRSSRRGHGR